MGNRKSHEIDYKIHGDDMQVVEIELDPQESVVAEAGAMAMMSNRTLSAKFSEPGKGFLQEKASL
jgi:uncharacterized protein (AIM24 family)